MGGWISKVLTCMTATLTMFSKSAIKIYYNLAVYCGVERQIMTELIAGSFKCPSPENPNAF